MAASTRSPSPLLAVHLAVTTNPTSGSFPTHSVVQCSDPVDLELEFVALLQPAIELETRSARRGSRAEHLARMKGLRERGVGDQVGKAVMHVRGGVLPPDLAVHAHGHAEVRGVELVRGDDAWAEHVRAVPVLPLRRAHADLHLLRLHVARREVVPDRPAEHVLERMLAGDVAAGLADYGGELELVIELVRVLRPRDLGLGPDHR